MMGSKGQSWGDRSTRLAGGRDRGAAPADARRGHGAGRLER